MTKKWQVRISHGTLKMWNCCISSANCDTDSDMYWGRTDAICVKQQRKILSMWPRGYTMLMKKWSTFTAWSQFNSIIGLTTHARTVIRHYLLIHFYNSTALLLFLAFLLYPPFLLLLLATLYISGMHLCMCVFVSVCVCF